MFISRQGDWRTNAPFGIDTSLVCSFALTIVGAESVTTNGSGCIALMIVAAFIDIWNIYACQSISQIIN